MKLRAVLMLLAAAFAASAAKVKPFVLNLKPGQTEYYVTATQAGTYWIVPETKAKVPVGIQHFSDLRWNKELPMHRRLLQANQTFANKTPLDRVIFKAGETKKLTFKYNTKEVEVKSIKFVPQFPVKVPKEAQNYKPALTPPLKHPRVLVNPQYLVWLKANLEKNENTAAWKTLSAQAQKPFKLKINPNKELSFDGMAVTAMRNKAFYYLMTGDQKIGKEAVDLARQYMSNVAFGNGQDICRKSGESIYSTALVYDWCYPLLTEEDKRVLQERMLYFAAEMETGWPPFKQNAAVGHGNEAQLSRDVMAMAIAVYNEDKVPWQYVAYQMLENLKPYKAFSYQSERHSQGTMYGQGRHGWDLFAALQFRRTFNYELLPRSASQVAYHHYYMRMPDGRFLLEGDRNWGWKPTYEGQSMNVLLANAALWKDPEIKSEIFRSSPKIATNDSLFFLLTNDPELKAQDLRSSMPLTRFFNPPLPAMYVRTGWNFSTSADDALISMQGAGYHFANHQHMDMGSFQIYYRGNIVSDLGQYRIYGVPYDTNLAKTSALHSLMRFQDPDQTKWERNARIYVNCGGQDLTKETLATELPPLLRENSVRHVGDTPRSGFGPDKTRPLYSFLEADLSRLFAGRAKEYSRTFVFLNQQDPNRPGTLFILDRFEVAKPSVQPIFQLTTIPRPEWKNGVLTASTAMYGKEGKLTLTPLIPAKVEAKLLTGKDAHTFAGKYIPPRNPKQPEANGTRTELTGEGNIYLNALQLHDGSLAALPVKAAVSGDRISAFLNMKPQKTDWADGCLVSFGKVMKTTQTAFAITVPQDKTYVLLLDLAPGSWRIAGSGTDLTVKVDGATGSAFIPLRKGTYTVTPGSSGKFMAPLTIQARPTPPPAQNQIWLKGKLLSNSVTIRKNGQLLLPLTALVKPQGDTLTITNGQTRVVLKVGDKYINVNNHLIPLPVALDQHFAVSVSLAGGLLGLNTETDLQNGTVLLSPKATPSDILYVTATDGESELSDMLQKQRGVWIAHGRKTQADITFIRPVSLSGMIFRWPHGLTRKQFFRVDLSSDGKTFETVFDGESSGRNIEQKITFEKRSVRLIRLYMKGNSSNTWNTVGPITLIP